MGDVIVVGGGPAGLSASLFTQKNGLETTVFDTGESWMPHAHLFNYLGIRSIRGEEFMTIARGQVEDRGVTLRQDEAVTDIDRAEDGFRIATDADDYEADYVILATGDTTDLAADLGCALTEDGVVDVDVTMETSIDDVYATGAMVRTGEYEAVISAGDGGAAALNVLSKERGEHYHDFDTPEDVPALSTPTE